MCQALYYTLQEYLIKSLKPSINVIAPFYMSKLRLKDVQVIQTIIGRADIETQAA